MAALGALSWSHRHEVAHGLSTQGALNQISVLTRQINNLTLVALRAEDLNSETRADLRAARNALQQAVLGAHQLAYHTPASKQVWRTFDNYTTSADHQWILMQVGDFAAAKEDSFRSVAPQFDAMEHQLQIAIEAEDTWTQAVALKARYELLASTVSGAAAILLLFLWFQKQKHLGQLQEAERNALRESEERFRALTEKSTDIILIADPLGEIKYASPSIHIVLSIPSSLVGTNLVELVHPDDLTKTLGAASRAPAFRQNASHPALEVRLRHAEGSWLYFECVVRNLLQDKNIAGIVYNARDITDRKHAQEDLLFSATHDVLTELPNRVLFLGRLQNVVDQIRRHPDRTAAVLFIDIDDFKLVNDCYGHATGDALLKEASNRLKACIRPDGTLSRMGGDEFTVLVEDIQEPSDAVRVAERIQDSFRRPFALDGIEVFKSTSIGIALISPETSAEAVLQNADIAMYRAKAKGKACTELFDRAMHEQVVSRLSLEAKLRTALQNGELMLHYQPIVRLDTGRIHGFEALLRWQPQRLHSIPPSTFIPVAEECGLIVPISLWILKTACMQAATWGRDYSTKPPLYVSVNISARHFCHGAFIEHVKDALQESAVDPACIIIELTESVAMSDVKGTSETMSQLRSLGVKMSIDDFGTGYSSLSYLRRFPVDTLKIDQSFVTTMDAENFAIIKTIIGLARNLDLNVIAEGVETIAQRELLALTGCEFAQGHLFAEPMPAQRVGDFIRSSRQPRRGKAFASITSTGQHSRFTQ
jgi:diguanylate cyclase (GGDEF)-like protein/PAS domain S-box-containing protein